VSNNTGFYPLTQVDTTNSAAVGQAGGVLLTQTIAAAGLGPAMSAALSGWRKPLAVHDPAKVVLDLAVTLSFGWGLPGRNRIPAWRTGPVWAGGLGCDGLADDRGLGCGRPSGFGCARRRPGRGSGTGLEAGRSHALDHGVSARTPLIVDLDATPAHSSTDVRHGSTGGNGALLTQTGATLERIADRGSSRCGWIAWEYAVLADFADRHDAARLRHQLAGGDSTVAPTEVAMPALSSSASTLSP
jgi:hypothetical protein